MNSWQRLPAILRDFSSLCWTFSFLCRCLYFHVIPFVNYWFCFLGYSCPIQEIISFTNIFNCFPYIFLQWFKSFKSYIKFHVLWSSLSWFFNRVRDKGLVSTFHMWISNFPRTICSKCCTFSSICFWQLCQKSIVWRCLDLFLGPFSSIILQICVYANSKLF